MLAALPGLPIGAVLVRVLPADALRVAIGVIVCALVAAPPARGARPQARRAPGRATAGIAGFSAGVLTTSTTTNGPPLALWLGGRGLPPAIVRDTVSAAFLMLDLVGLGVVLAVVGPHRALAEAVWLPALDPRRARSATSPAAGSSGACPRTTTTSSSCSPSPPPGRSASARACAESALTSASRPLVSSQSVAWIACSGHESTASSTPSSCSGATVPSPITTA